MQEDESPRSIGEIVDLQGKRAQVRLEDGRVVPALFARRMGCIFGSVIGWKVEVQFRKNPNKPVLIIRRAA